MSVEDKLAEMGLTLPEQAAPAANYVSYVISGNMLYVSGQVAANADGFVVGTLGDDMDVEAGQAAARLCALSLLAQVKSACGGDFSKLVRVVKLGAFVNSTSDFLQQPQVVNGASDLFVEVLGDKGRHARSAVSSPSLPFGVAVEIDGVFEIKD